MIQQQQQQPLLLLLFFNLTLCQWTRISTSYETNLAGFGYAYSETTNTMIAYGNSSGSGNIWKLNLMTKPFNLLLLFHLTSSPGGRNNSAVFYDDVKNRLIIHGGSGSGTTVFGDTWILDLSSNSGSSSSVVAQILTGPSPRTGMGYFRYKQDCFIFGGQISENEMFNDVWKFSSSDYEWENVISGSSSSDSSITSPTNNPKPRSFPGQYYDNKSGVYYIFSGRQQQQRGNGIHDFWKFIPENKTWIMIFDMSSSTTTTTTTTTRPLIDPTIFVDVDRQLLLIFNGIIQQIDNLIASNSRIHIYDIINNTWYPTTENELFNDDPGYYGKIGVSSIRNRPSARSASILLPHREDNCIYLYGTVGIRGDDGSYGVLSDLWRYEYEFVSSATTTTPTATTTTTATQSSVSGVVVSIILGTVINCIVLLMFIRAIVRKSIHDKS